MSLYFTGTAGYLASTTVVGSTATNVTLCGWFKVTDDNGGAQTTLAYSDDGASFSLRLQWDDASGNMAVQSVDNTFNDDLFASRPAVGEWFFAWLRCSGLGADQIEAGWARSGDVSFVTASCGAGVGVTVAGATIIWCGDGSNDPDAMFAHPRAWAAVLTDAELMLEMYSMLPVRLANIVAAFREVSAASVTDLSGTQGAPIIGGTPTVDEDPPIDDMLYPPRGRFSTVFSMPSVTGYGPSRSQLASLV